MDHIQSVQKVLTENNLDAVFVSSPLTIGYVTGFFGISPTERESFVVVTKKSCYILTSQLYLADVTKTCKNCIPIEVSVSLSWEKAVAQIVEKEHVSTLGYEDYNITVAEQKKLLPTVSTLIPISLRNLQVIKDHAEIAKIKKACDIGDQAFSHVLSHIKPGVTEVEIAFELEIFMRNKFAIPSFPSIVAFGPHAAVPHHKSDTTPLKKDQFVLLDFGVLLGNYCSDMTRTVFVGTPSEQDKKIYATVKGSQEKAFAYLAKNASDQNIQAKEVDKTSRDFILLQGFNEFPHSLGHGIGLAVHEAPSLSPFSLDTLKPGMVFSIEPGIYLPEDTGVRIEDLLTLTQTSFQQLTLSPRDLIVL